MKTAEATVRPIPFVLVSPTILHLDDFEVERQMEDAEAMDRTRVGGIGSC
jgi:hypothetical protein